MRVGVIGTGFGARVVAPAFAATAGCEVVDVVSPRDPFAVEHLCRRTDLDLVSIHSPPFLHGSDVELGLGWRHHVLCDKPFGLSADESRRMADEARAARVVALVNFEFRFQPVRERLRSLVLDGAVGTPEHVTWTVVSSSTRVPLRPYGWLFDRARGGGSVGAWGSHAVDFLRWTFGEIVDASAVLRTDVAARPDRDAPDQLRPCDADDGFTATLRTESGVTATLEASFAAPADLAPRLVVAGSEGLLECVADARLTLRRAGSPEPETIDVPPGDGDPRTVPMRRWAEVVRDAVHEGRAAEPSFEDGWACDVVLDRLRAGQRWTSPPASST